MHYSFHFKFWHRLVFFIRHDKHDENNDYASWAQLTLGLDGLDE